MLVSPRSAPPVMKALAPCLLSLGLVGVSCAEPSIEAKAAAVIAADTTGPGNVDLLFMIDNSSGMPAMQQKLAEQIPAFLQVFESLPSGMPNFHIAVVSSDLGAPGDSPAETGCTLGGDQGVFQAIPRGTCADTTLTPGAAFISSVDGVTNYTAPDISGVLQCIVPLGGQGCGFGHQLGAVARALGADGSPAPAQNAGFLRADAVLAIIILSDADDCSAATTVLYSLNGGHQNLTNALGPIAHYRCNEFGHLCFDSHSPFSLTNPPEMAPADAQGTPSAPTYAMTQCQSNDTDGLLAPVSMLVSGIKALKSNPDRQIVVGAIVAPAQPYTVAWAPSVNGTNATPGELWPQIEHACDETTTDGSFGDPAVRIIQFVQAFGDNGSTTSICDASYTSVVGAMVEKIAAYDQSSTLPPPTGGSGGDAGIGSTGEGGGTDGGSGGSPAAGTGGSSFTGTGGSSGPSATGGSGSAVPDGLHEGCGCDVGRGRDGTGGRSFEFVLVLLAIRRRRARGVET